MPKARRHFMAGKSSTTAGPRGQILKVGDSRQIGVRPCFVEKHLLSRSDPSLLLRGESAHSALRARMGSMLAARLAGTRLATSAASDNDATASRKARGSLASRPKRNAFAVDLRDQSPR